MGWTVARMMIKEFILIFRLGTYCKIATWKTIKGIVLEDGKWMVLAHCRALIRFGI
jgi:hypothetical protein